MNPAELRAKIQEALDSIITPAPYALLDFPDHSNVGDSAIYLGELKYLKRRMGRAPTVVGKQHNINHDAVDRKCDVILLHGGGNFGDVWPKYDAFRADIIKRYPHKKIIQLPQTIHYEDTSKLDEMRRLISAHKDFSLCVRDDRSLDIALTFQCCVVRSPDSAFMLEPRGLPAPKYDGVFLRRQDKESSHSIETPKGFVDVDWLDEPKNTRNWALAAAAPFGASRHKFYEALARARLKRGLRLISSGRTLLTDRLHGHILATLIGQPHWVLDNNYGKVFSFMETWGTDMGSAPGRRITDPSDVATTTLAPTPMRKSRGIR